MSAPAAVSLVTTEELLAMPEDGMERYLIRGQLRERPLTLSDGPHSWTEARITYLFWRWLELQPEPRGEVYCGEAGFRLCRNPDTTVGIDVAYISAELAAATPRNVRLIDGVPIVAVEILSPTNTIEEIVEKVEDYLAVGVKLVWVVDPYFRTVTVYRPDAEPELLNVTQELSAEPYLPGFRVRVAEIFPQQPAGR